jgi:predicted nucleic acid-binding protein
LYPVTRGTLTSAGGLIEKLSGRIVLKTLDAIHLATCLEYSLFPIFTNDKIMLSAAKELKIEIVH